MSTRAFVAVSLLAAASLAFAGSSGSPKGATSKASSDAVTASKEKLTGTYDVTGNGQSASLPQFSFTTVADTSVNCGKKACSIGIEAMAQIQSAGADWAICLVVDGGDVECQYQGIQAGPSSFVSGNARGFISGLSSGTHDVQLQLYSESATGTYQFFDMDARTYTP